jgi:hypothetical protein
MQMIRVYQLFTFREGCIAMMAATTTFDPIPGFPSNLFFLELNHIILQSTSMFFPRRFDIPNDRARRADRWQSIGITVSG